MTPAEEREYRLKGKLFRKVHEHLELDVQGVGDLDLALGWPFLKELWADSSVPLVCANLVEKASGERPFPAWTVVERGGLKLAFIGLMSDAETARPPRHIEDLLEITDPEEALRKALKELEGVEKDLVVLVSHLGKPAELEIAREVPGLDVIVGGHSGDVLRAPLESNGVVIVQAGRRGKRVGRLDLWYNPEGEPGAEEYVGAEKDARETAAEFPKRLAYTNRIENLKKKLEYDSTIENWIKEYKEEVQALPPLAELEVPDLPGEEDDEEPLVADRFWGSATCSKCHLQQAEWWRNTTHAHAFQTLVGVMSEKRADCIACHSVGYKDPGGFQEPAMVQNLKNVGCESCHGRGDHHGQLDKFNTAPRAEKTCLQCHTPERDPEWDPAKIDQVACPTLDVAPVAVPVPKHFMLPKGSARYVPEEGEEPVDVHDGEAVRPRARSTGGMDPHKGSGHEGHDHGAHEGHDH